MSPAIICFICVAYTAGVFPGEPAFPIPMAAVVLNAVGKLYSWQDVQSWIQTMWASLVVSLRTLNEEIQRFYKVKEPGEHTG